MRKIKIADEQYNQKNRIVEKLNEKFKIIQKVSGYKYGEDTILLFKLFQDSLNKKNIKLLDIGTGNGILPILLSDNEFLTELIGIDIQKEIRKRQYQS